MGSEDVYILGINMTKFGKHKELDVPDLAVRGHARGAEETAASR